MPTWMAGIDRLQPLQASGLGALRAAINPKNGALTIAAGAVMALLVLVFAAKLIGNGIAILF